MKKDFIKNFYNSIDFFLRQKIKLKRKYIGKNEPKNNLFPDFSEEKRQIAEEKEKFYLEKYNLNYLKNNSTQRNYLENLATIELLEKVMDNEGFLTSESTIKILDIGSKNWFYAAGEWSFFKSNINKEIYLDGIEIDAFRVYSDFHTRWDYANFYIKNLKNTRYIAGDFLKHNEKYDYILWFFPFVTEFPLQEWGLPLSKFKPLEMLRHAYGCLNSDGKILIVNQDEKEYQIQEGLIKELSCSYEKKGDIKNSFIEYERSRFATIIYKNK
jgi:hypothetical protein